MTRNIIFEIGEVLIKWNPILIIEKEFPKSISNNIIKDIFTSEAEFAWLKGELEYKHALEKLVPELQKKYPDLNFTYESLYNLMEEIKKTLTPVEGMKDLIEDLNKNNEYKLYIFSEIGDYIGDHYKTFPIIQFFGDNVIFTSDKNIKCLKSDENSYNKFLVINNLNPEDCIFVEREKKNVNKAIEAGCKAIKFEGEKSLDVFIKNIIKTNKALSISQ